MTTRLETAEEMADLMVPLGPTDVREFVVRAVRARDEHWRALLAPLLVAHEAMEKRPGASELDDFVLAARRACEFVRGWRDTEPAPPMLTHPEPPDLLAGG